jgi:circadian clock protein KaiB
MKRRERKPKIVAPGAASAELLKSLAGQPLLRYGFRLYIAGSNLNSSRAIQHFRELCRLLVPSKCDLEIIDLYQQPALAKRDNVLAAPALIKISPLPSRTFVGDLSDMRKVLAGLGILAANVKDVRTESTG